MYEVFSPSDNLFSIMITIDILVAEVWMAFLLIGIGNILLLSTWRNIAGLKLQGGDAIAVFAGEPLRG